MLRMRSEVDAVHSLVLALADVQFTEENRMGRRQFTGQSHSLGVSYPGHQMSLSALCCAASLCLLMSSVAAAAF